MCNITISYRYAEVVLEIMVLTVLRHFTTSHECDDTRITMTHTGNKFKTSSFYFYCKLILPVKSKLTRKR